MRLSIEAESTWDRALERGVELGLFNVDGKFVVTGHNEDEVRNWARRPNVIEGLNRLLDLSDGSFQIINGRLYVDVFGIEKEPELASYIEDLIRRLVAIVSCISVKQIETTKRPMIDNDPADSIGSSPRILGWRQVVIACKAIGPVAESHAGHRACVPSAESHAGLRTNCSVNLRWAARLE